jgi:hypothetical protein
MTATYVHWPQLIVCSARPADGLSARREHVKAIVQETYGSTDVLQFRDFPMSPART